MRTIILIILVAFAVGAVASAAPMVTVVSADPHVDLTITTSQDWMVADNKDSVTITATAIQGTGEFAGDPLEGANVSFEVGSPWELKNTLVLTDKNGIAKTTLKATKVSGNATIRVNASAWITTETWGTLYYSTIVNLNQPIDHGTPSSLVTNFKSKVQVLTPTRLSILMKDANGNPVDNRRVVEVVQFDASSTGQSGFLSGSSWVKSLRVPVNESGYADADYLVDPVGTNYIVITPPSPLLMKLISLEGISQAVPFSISSIASPPGTPYPYTVVKTGIFTIGFTFYDQNGFPTSNQPVNVTTSIPGEAMSIITNKNGMAVISYGPKDIAGIYTITAKAFNNQSVSTSQKVEFISGKATDAFLTASPQTMASRDVKDDLTSDLIVRVVDKKGNPVAGEEVSFRFLSISDDPSLNLTAFPAIENDGAFVTATGSDVTAVSDVNGLATIKFHPGAFTTDIMAPGYSAQASATAVVEAQWSNVKKQVTLKYLNYPYLTVESWVNPTTLRVNDTVDVTVKVTGDGWALQPKPIKVILVNDRSGSMLYDDPDRIYSVMQAGKQFVGKMDSGHDAVGLVSFGWNGTVSEPGVNSGLTGDIDNSYIYPRTYGSYATLDAPLGTTFPAVLSTIDTMVPDGGTPTRLALKVAIDELVAHTNPKDPSVKAIILLSDGEYNWYGDPLARGTASSTKDPTSYSNLATGYRSFSGVPSQNMSAYAKQYNITIYTIGFASSITSGCRASLIGIANGTVGGMYFPATAADLSDIYTRIAGSLKDTAGVNTTMDLSFQNVMVEKDIIPGDEVYEYRYIDGRSTLVNYWNVSGNFPGYPRTVDSTSQWNTTRNLSFNIGTIRLGESWQSTVSLRVLKEGTIKVLGAGSVINTQGASKVLTIPDTFITALPNTSAFPLQTAARLQVRSLTVTNPGSKTYADLKWNLVYNGMYPVSENVMIAPYGTEDWIRLPTKETPNTTVWDTASLNIDNLPEGCYTIQIDGAAFDANEDSDSINILLSETNGISVLPPGVTPAPTPSGTPPKSYIRFS
ncbi:MAG: VWA domain-containing protein [Methanomicrobiales archaeon]|nr:VWA domain-containing protein [Methanomicrobiales archaeon]